MIGLLKNRVIVKKEIKQANGRGGFTINELEIGERWAAILPMTAREIAQYMQLDRQLDTRLIMRRDPEIDTACVIYYKDRRYQVDQALDRLDHSGFMDLITRGEKING